MNPLVDFFVISGGLMWCLFLLHQCLPTMGGEQASFEAAALIISVMLAEAHVMATLIRVYESNDARNKHPYFVAFGPAGIAALIVLLCNSKDALGVITVLYLFASIHHGLRQSYGISLLYCMRTGFRMSQVDRKLLSIFLHSATVFAIVRQLSLLEFVKSPLPGVELTLIQFIPEWVASSMGAVCALLGLLFFLTVIKKSISESTNFPALAGLLIINSILVVVFSREIAGDLWIFVPGFFHGSQYLAITIVHRIGRLSEKKDLHVSTCSEISQYLFVLLVLSFLVYGLIPMGLHHLRVPFYTATAAVFLAFVLHHFWADALIWKLKDPSIARAFDLSFERSGPAL